MLDERLDSDEVLCKRYHCTAETMTARRLLNSGVESYLDGDWDGAPSWIDASRWELYITAYGVDAITADFASYCADPSTKPTKIPIKTYLNVIDTRLGSAPKDAPPLPDDPQVAELVSLSYETLLFLPESAAVIKALAVDTFADIADALKKHGEATTTKSDRNAFWANGNAHAIILAYRRKSEKDEADMNSRAETEARKKIKPTTIGVKS